VLEITLHDGLDPRTGGQLGPHTGDPRQFATFEQLFAAFETQVRHFVAIKLRGNALIERLYADTMPAPFLSLITSDCIERGLDYNEGGARYNTSFIQGVGIGTLTDSLAALRTLVFEDRAIGIDELLDAMDADYEGQEALRQRLRNRAPKWGNDNDSADGLMRAAFDAFVSAIDGKPNGRGGSYGVDMLPTTAHVYFGSVTGATPDGRVSGFPVSEGVSPVQGMDRKGMAAVFRSVSKIDWIRTGGSLLNQKLTPDLFDDQGNIIKLASLIRGYFRAGGYHVQFNVISADLLREAQRRPQDFQDLMVRVAGYSDYFVKLPKGLQEEIIARTEQNV